MALKLSQVKDTGSTERGRNFLEPRGSPCLKPQAAMESGDHGPLQPEALSPAFVPHSYLLSLQASLYTSRFSFILSPDCIGLDFPLSTPEGQNLIGLIRYHCPVRHRLFRLPVEQTFKCQTHSEGLIDPSSFL